MKIKIVFFLPAAGDSEDVIEADIYETDGDGNLVIGKGDKNIKVYSRRVWQTVEIVEE